MMRFRGGFTNGPGPKCHDPGPRFDVDWDDKSIRDTLITRTVRNKDDLVLFSCSDFTFLDSNGVSKIYAVTFDADCAKVGSLKKVIAHLRELELAFIVYTSFSHKMVKQRSDGTTGSWDCFRVILPLSRPIVEKGIYKKLYSAVLDEGLLPPNDAWDKTARMMARGWYEPGTTKEYIDQALFEVGMGEPVDVEYLVATQSKEPRRDANNKRWPNGATNGNGGASSTDATRIQKLLNAFAAKLAEAGYPLESTDPEGENRGHCPACKKNHDPSLSVRTEGRRILLTCYRGCGVDEIVSSIGCTIGDLFVGSLGDLEGSIQRAFMSDRIEPYTLEELSAMEPLDRRWIIQAPGGYFIRSPGGDYEGPMPRDHVMNLARDLLAPAVSADVSVFFETAKGGLKLKSLGELLHDYGCTLVDTEFSYFRGTCIEGRKIVRRTAIPVDLPAQFDKQIDQWLKLFAGPQYEPFLDWLATVHDLAKATCAVFISGTSGAGKDLFVEGLSEIWAGRYTPFHRAQAKHNDLLLQSPIIFANETLAGSSDFMWNPVEALKAMISENQRTIEPKNQQAVTLTGCIRLIAASNSRGVFKLGRQPTQSDIQALDDRILLLRPGQDCREYLISLGGMATTEGWVAGGGLARHIMWLRENRKVQYGGRLIVHGRGGMSELLSADGKGSAVVLRALLNALCGRNRDERVCRIHHDEVWWSVANLREKWSMFAKVDLPEDMGEVASVISVPGSSKLIKIGGKPVRMRQLQVAVLEEAAIREDMLEDLEVLFGIREEA